MFYCDPPYYKCPFYAHNLALPDFEKMADVLARIKGRFILSLNDHPDIRGVFDAFEIQPVTLKYSVAVGKQKIGKELIISN